MPAVCDNCRILAETVRSLGEALAMRDRKTVSMVQHPPVPVVGLESAIDQAIAKRAAGDERLRLHLQAYAVSAMSAGQDPDAIVRDIIDGE
jgi:hypothetical protein